MKRCEACEGSGCHIGGVSPLRWITCFVCFGIGVLGTGWRSAIFAARS